MSVRPSDHYNICFYLHPVERPPGRLDGEAGEHTLAAQGHPVTHDLTLKQYNFTAVVHKLLDAEA